VDLGAVDPGTVDLHTVDLDPVDRARGAKLEPDDLGPVDQPDQHPDRPSDFDSDAAGSGGAVANRDDTDERNPHGAGADPDDTDGNADGSPNHADRDGHQPHRHRFDDRPVVDGDTGHHTDRDRRSVA
ncbi:MAG: hypothetical protein FWD04_10405, partial [Conexibacteraceae bacterium]|nr:hypothetical protein [Conexibacteraceae bacterium]